MFLIYEFIVNFTHFHEMCEAYLCQNIYNFILKRLLGNSLSVQKQCTNFILKHNLYFYKALKIDLYNINKTFLIKKFIVVLKTFQSLNIMKFATKYTSCC